MASFTDTQLPRFNPYIQQQPVEAMVTVGMAKQKAHDEGVQKIQTQIDNIAGIDVGRDVDKAYLQSKINQLGNDLRSVAGGDFGNFQLVNSVGGMIKQIGYDPYIKAAVASTANDRKEMALMEEDRKAGKLVPHAEFYYGLKRQQYYGNNSLKTKDGKPVGFSGKYVKGWDLDKELLEAVKAVGEGKYSVDNVFKINPQTGKIMTDRNGAPIYSEFAIKETREGKFSENIAAAIDGVMSRPEARQELAMRGVYNYRGNDSIEDFVKGYQKEREQAIKSIEDSRFDAMSKYVMEKDPAKKAQLEAIINQKDQLLTEAAIEDPRINDARQFGDVNAYKAALETRRVRNNYMLSSVTEKTSREYIKSIPYEVAREKIKDRQEWWAKQQNVAQGWASHDLAVKKFGLDVRKQGFDEMKWQYDPTNPERILPESPGATKTQADMEDVYSVKEKEGMELIANHTEEAKDFARNYVMAVQAGNPKVAKKLSIDEINGVINKKMREDPNWLTVFTEKAKRNVKSQPTNPYFTDLATSVPALEQAEHSIQRHNGLMESIEKDARVVAVKGEGGGDVTKGMPSYRVTYNSLTGYNSSERKTIMVTPKDLSNVALASRYNAMSPKEMKSLTPEEKSRYQNAERAIEQRYGFGYETVKAIAFKDRKLVDNYNKIWGKTAEVDYKAVADMKNTVMREKLGANESKLYPMYMPNSKGPEIATSNQNVLNVLNTWKEANNDSDIDVSKYAAAFAGKDKDKYVVNIGVDRSGAKDSYSLELYDGEQKVQSIPIPEKQARQIRPDLKLPPRMSEAQQRIIQSPTGNTTNSITSNLTDPDASRGAYIQQNFFIQRYNRTDIEGADVKINKMGETNLYLYKKDARTGETIALPIKRPGAVYPEPFATPEVALDFLQNTLTTSGQIDNFIRNTK